MLKHIAALLFAGSALLGSAQAAAEQPLLQEPSDLRHEAQLVHKQHTPLIVLFSLPGCPYCKVVRRNYLAPLVRDAAPGHKPVIREVDITSDKPLTDFDGTRLTQSSFSARYHVKATPTVIMMDAKGAPLTEPLIGGDTAGFYGAYLDNAMAAAQKALDKSAGTPGK